MTVRGYAVLYGVESQFLQQGLCREIIALGAFDFSARAGVAPDGSDIVACLNHNHGRRFGKRLRLWSDDVGVGFEIHGAKIPPGCTGCSFQFEAVRWRCPSDLLCVLERGDLLHVTLLTHPQQPAYPATRDYLEELP